MKKPCAGCGKQIPEAALHCVFCGTKQEVQAAEPGATVEAAPPSAVPPEAAKIEASQPSRTHNTLFGLRVDDIDKGPPAAQGEGATPTPVSLERTPQRGLPVIERDSTPPQPQASAFSALVRLVMLSGGAVLIALFWLPWRGTSSWLLLETLAGADFVRQLFFLAGGAVLLATAVLPVPASFRATIGAMVAALPLVLGAAGLLDGWRGLGAALAIIVLAATHLMRTRSAARLDRTARGLVMAAAAAVGLLYLVPSSSVVPLVYVGRLLGSMSVEHTVVGLFISIPLVLAALSLLGALGRDLTSVAVLLAVLLLLWAPAAVLIFIGDGTQLYLALALLWSSATAALCVAQLLTFAASTATRRA